VQTGAEPKVISRPANCDVTGTGSGKGYLAYKRTTSVACRRMACPFHIARRIYRSAPNAGTRISGKRMAGRWAAIAARLKI
jgi:hypothetical protein